MSKFMRKADDSSSDESDTEEITNMNKDEVIDDTFALLDEQNIIIFGQKKGRRTNTYIINWNIAEDELKNALKNMKKKYGCNGSIKMVNYEGNDIKALQLQGDQIAKAHVYLISLGITDVIIKDII